MPSVIILSVIMPSVIMLSAKMPTVIMLYGVRLNVKCRVSLSYRSFGCHYVKCRFAECCSATSKRHNVMTSLARNNSDVTRRTWSFFVSTNSLNRLECFASPSNSNFNQFLKSSLQFKKIYNMNLQIFKFVRIVIMTIIENFFVILIPSAYVIKIPQ